MTPVVRSRVRICSRGMNAFSGYKLLVKIAHTLLKKVGSTHSKTLQHSGLNIFLFPQFGIFQFQALIFHTKSRKCTENPDQLKPEYLNSGHLVFYTTVQNVRFYLTESFFYNSKLFGTGLSDILTTVQIREIYTQLSSADGVLCLRPSVCRL